jgi:hypothetical protein
MMGLFRERIVVYVNNGYVLRYLVAYDILRDKMVEMSVYVFIFKYYKISL